jgi:lipopolysaccharide/colanic/teichoic acid biosynthesis glycosyltransferase
LKQVGCVSNLEELNDSIAFVGSCGRSHSASFESCLKSPPASPWIRSYCRRIVDVLIALVVLIVCAVPMGLTAVAVRLTSKGKAIFTQERVGRGGRLFRIYKFRSMAETSRGHVGPGLTKDGDLRVTPLGRFLRKFKLDELPQFYNILRGDMSLIGPRPKLPKYVAMFNMPYRPGISGAATLVFRREEEILRNLDAGEIEAFYEKHIKPFKARIDACYMCKATALTDIRLAGATFLACVKPASSAVGGRSNLLPDGEGIPASLRTSGEQRLAAPLKG